MILLENKDPIGRALKDYYQAGEAEPITVLLDIAEDDVMEPGYFFREYDQCPELEQIALKNARGKVLDVGGGAGSHSLYLQKNGVDVTTLDISPNSVDVMKERGLKNVLLTDFYDYSASTFDTLLFLMNGIGLVSTLDGFDEFFKQARKLMNPKGQILLDSSDLIYLYEQKDGSYLIDLSEKYHGEVEFSLSYKDIKGEPFKWLYISHELLADAAEENGFKCEILKEGEHYDYLARLTVIDQ